MYVKLFRRLLDQAGEGGEGGGGAGAGDNAAAVQAAVDAAVAGLKTKNQELLGTVRELKDTVKSFEGLDPVKVKAMLAQFENNEDAKLLAEGKVEEVIAKRTAKRDADWQAKLDAAANTAAAEKARTERFLGRVLDDQVRAAVTGKVHDKAIEDALFRARQIFTLTEDGVAVQMQDGGPVLGKDGKTPFSPAEWIDAMRESAPHWFPATGSGSGAPPSGGGAGSKQIKRSAFEALTHIERATKMREGVQIIDG